ncbi:PKD domain-containing protein [Actinomycetota bacterium]
MLSRKSLIPKLVVFLLTISLALMLSGQFVYADSETTVNYGDLTLNSPWEVTHWSDVWDLTQGDLTLSYTIDMKGLNQPGTWNTFQSWQTWYTEVGLRGEDAGDFNPGPFGVYQGRCGGWMVSDSDVWTDGDGYTEHGVDPDSTQDLDDKHALQASGGRGEGDYDVLDSDWDTVLAKFGSGNNFGIWFDRDGVDQWQDDMWGNLGPGGVGSGDGLRYNTDGVYDIVITYHAIDDGLGVMFATVNGYSQGFYAPWVDGPPQNYPAGLSFKGDMQHMQVFAGLWSPSAPAGHDYGYADLSDIEVTGFLGTSDPLVADFTYNPVAIYEGVEVQFTDATHGGMPPYTYAWDFNNDTVVDSTDQNPTWTYNTAGAYDITLTVTPFRCVTKSVTKTITVETPPGTGTPGYWMNHPEAWPVNEITIGGETYDKNEAIQLIKDSTKKDVTYIMFQALLAAKLNVLVGNDASCIASTIIDADAWMADYGPVGSEVKAGGKNGPWRIGEELYIMLDDYNNGLLCAPHRD